MTPIATSLLHRIQRDLLDLADLRDEEGRMRIHEALACHVRSIAPMAAPEARAEVTRQLADESEYRLSIVEGCLVVRWSDANERETLSTLSTLTDIEVQRLRLDADAVMRSRP